MGSVASKIAQESTYGRAWQVKKIVAALHANCVEPCVMHAIESKLLQASTARTLACILTLCARC